MTIPELRALLAKANTETKESDSVMTVEHEDRSETLWFLLDSASDKGGTFIGQFLREADAHAAAAAWNEAPALLDRLERAEGLLRSLEWSSMESCRHPFDAKDKYPSGSCPECCGTQWWDWQTSETLPQGGHAPDCELAAILKASG